MTASDQQPRTHDVAEIDADGQLDAVVRRDSSVSLGYRLLHRDSAAHRIDDAPELYQHAVLIRSAVSASRWTALA
jgi:hypothetical protein